MGKLALLFPGQGSQTVGMGADLQQEHPALWERYFARADAVADLPITQYCIEGPLDTLTRTEIAQPALFAHALALTEHARALGLRPDFVAGHSLGEYTAAVACGALSLDDGLPLVCQRGQLMAAIQAQQPGTMAAIMGLDSERLAALCEQASAAGVVALANLN